MLVDLAGIEPATSSMPWKRAPSCATGPLCGRNAAHADDVNYIFSQRFSLVKPPPSRRRDAPSLFGHGTVV